MTKKSQMTKTAAARIQSSTAKKGGNTSKGSFSARAQRAASKNSSSGGN